MPVVRLDSHRRPVGSEPRRDLDAVPPRPRVVTDGSEYPPALAPMAPLNFSVEVTREHDTAHLVPAGEIDLATVGQLGRELDALVAAGCARIVVDLRAVEFLDSTGLHALFCAHARAAENGWQLAIIPGPRPVQRIFEITGAIDLLPFVEAEDPAHGQRD